jgi:hypothetical protein
MQRIIEYKICYGLSQDGIEEKVNQLINKGWQLRGDTHFEKLAHGYVEYHQVMVKSEEM